MNWVEARWIPRESREDWGPWMTIETEVPSLRDQGGVLAQANHRAAEYASESFWESRVSIPEWGNFWVLSAWVLSYEVGQFSALHTDRPDSDITALVALNSSSDPLVVCRELEQLNDSELRHFAQDTPHPPGTNIRLSADEALFIRGSRTPHHRPPVRGRSLVLSISLRSDD